LAHRAKTHSSLNPQIAHPKAGVFSWLTSSRKRTTRRAVKEVSMFHSIFALKDKKIPREEQRPLPFAVWTEQMSVSVKLLDNDHKKLALLVSDLHDGVMQGRPQPMLEGHFATLVRHLRTHIAHEEQLFAETAYPEAAIHQREHEFLMERVLDLQMRFGRENSAEGYLELVNLLKGWLFSHFQSSDQEYAPYFKSKGVDAIMAKRERQAPVARKRAENKARVMQASW
jgi:hemerythrin-like metal-binding protein